MVRVAVIGAGVNGMGCAVKIKEKYPHFDVVVISKDFTPNTTGDGSAGLWYPYLCGNTHSDKLLKWGIETYKFMHKLWLEGAEGVCLLPVYVLYQEPQTEGLPSWGSEVFGLNILNTKQIAYLRDLYSTAYVFGFTFTTFTFEPSKLLPYLMQRFKTAGGDIQRCLITSLKEECLKDYDIVINCTGLEARTVTPDIKMFPIRGQVCRVKAPWLNYVITDETSGHYIIPNVEAVVLGGTHQENAYNTSVDRSDLSFILDGCKRILPGLKNSEITKHWVGLRPGREAVRLEAERADKLYIHNYGHGGSGVTLFWGCATEVLEIIDKALPSTKSKL